MKRCFLRRDRYTECQKAAAGYNEPPGEDNVEKRLEEMESVT